MPGKVLQNDVKKRESELCDWPRLWCEWSSSARSTNTAKVHSGSERNIQRLLTLATVQHLTLFHWTDRRERERDRREVWEGESGSVAINARVVLPLVARSQGWLWVNCCILCIIHLSCIWRVFWLIIGRQKPHSKRSVEVTSSCSICFFCFLFIKIKQIQINLISLRLGQPKKCTGNTRTIC